MSKYWTDKLVALGACPDAVEWARAYPSLTAAWKVCERADWMFWLAGKLCRTVPARKRLVLAACACARTALKYVPEGEKRPLMAVRTAEQWARGTGGVTVEDVRAAGDAAFAAAGAAAGAAARAAARDASWAAWDAAGAAARAAAWAAGTAWAAWAAWDAARDAAWAARDAAWAAWAAAWDAARGAAKTKALSRLSKIVRKHYPIPPRWGRRG